MAKQQHYTAPLMTADDMPPETEESRGQDEGVEPEPAKSNGTASLVKTPASSPKALAKVGEQAPIPIEGGRLTPEHSDHLHRMAALAFAAGLAPKGSQNVQQVIMGIAAGMEAGLSFVQSCRQVMVVNGSPSLWGDAPLGLVMTSGNLEDLRVEWTGQGDDMTCTVVVKRKGVATVQSGTFSVAMAKRARLWGKTGPWTSYPERMIELRARAFALRNAFPDKLMGLGIAEEIEDAETEIAAKKSEDLTNRIGSLDAPTT